MFSGVIIYLILQTPSLHLIQAGGFSLTVPIYSDICLADLCGKFDLDRIHHLRHLKQGIIPVFGNTNS